MSKKNEFIIVHCSDSAWGTEKDINDWHVQRGFTEIGYNWVILNQYPTYTSLKANKPVIENDGKLVGGRDLDKDGDHDEEDGAHCLGYNKISLGVCLIGDRRKDGTLTFTRAQYDALVNFLVEKCKKYGIPSDKVLGHRETKSGHDEGKTCPELDMGAVRDELRERLSDG